MSTIESKSLNWFTIATTVVVVSAVTLSAVFLVRVFRQVAEPDPEILAREQIELDQESYEEILAGKLRPRE